LQGFASLLAVLCASQAQSQSTTTTSAAINDEEMVNLAPFEVRTDRDVGYYAADTLAGGRTNSSLKDTAAAITVMNRQFIDDIAATDIYQAEIWNVNAFPTYNAQFGTTGNQSRGANFSFFSRNYFLWYTSSDTFSTERFDFSRGPNGVLFGDGNIGGLATTMTKQAKLSKNFSSVKARGDSWGGLRAEADINVSYKDRAALRVALLESRGTMWQDHSDQNRRGAYIAGTIKLFPKTDLRFDGEVGKIENQPYYAFYTDRTSYWDKTTSYNGIGTLNTTVGGPGVSRVSTSGTYLVDIPDSSISIQNWNTFYRSEGAQIAMRPDSRGDLPVQIPRLSRREQNLAPRNARYELEYATSTIYLEHRFTDGLYAQVAYNATRTPWIASPTDQGLSSIYIDVNTVLPNGQPNPNYGKPYVESAVQTTKQMNTVSEARAFIAYQANTRWWKGNFNLLAGSRFDKFDYEQKRLTWVNNPAIPNVSSVSNEYHFRAYLDQPTPDINPNPSQGAYQFDYTKYQGLTHQRKFIDYYQLASVHKVWDDRITVYLGARSDHVFQSQQSLFGYDALGNPILGGIPTPAPGTQATARAGAYTKIDRTATSRNAGIIYYPIPWIGGYFNYSETFGTPDSGDNLIDGSLPPISKSSSKEYGIKLNLLKDKIYVDARYYDSQQENQVIGSTLGNNFNAIWTALGKPTIPTYRDTQGYNMRGLEFELVANPTKSIRIMANFSRPLEQKNVDAYPDTKAYYAANAVEWNSSRNIAAVNTQLTTIENFLRNNANLATSNGFTKYRANFYGTYTFNRGTLKGLAAGTGINYVGPSKIGVKASSFDYFYSQSYYLLSGHVAYNFKFRKRDLSVQLNVTNLLDEDEVVNTSSLVYRLNGVTANPANYVPGNFRFQDPRKIVVSATMKF
jgi:outer membrane receptor protein involved in Fe transport